MNFFSLPAPLEGELVDRKREKEKERKKEEKKERKKDGKKERKRKRLPSSADIQTGPPGSSLI